LVDVWSKLDDFFTKRLVSLAELQQQSSWDKRNKNGSPVKVAKLRIIHLISCQNFIFTKLAIWGRCYDHNFLRCSTIFVEKMRFSKKNNVMIQFLYNLASFRVKNTIFSPNSFQGSMLWSQFSAIFDNIRRKNAVFLKTNVMINILHILALFWVKNAIFLLNFLAKIFKKIVTSVPGFNEIKLHRLSMIYLFVYARIPFLNCKIGRYLKLPGSPGPDRLQLPTTRVYLCNAGVVLKLLENSAQEKWKKMFLTKWVCPYEWSLPLWVKFAPMDEVCP
jgi:hypothetical protein